MTLQVVLLSIMEISTIGIWWYKYSTRNEKHNFSRDGARGVVINLTIIVSASFGFMIQDFIDGEYVSSLMFGSIFLTWIICCIVYFCLKAKNTLPVSGHI